MTVKGNLHFQALPLSQRITFTMTLLVLGMGYLFAMIHVFASHAGRDGNPALGVQDLEIAYSGSDSDTRLEAALKGPMQGMLPAGERETIIAWVRRGADQGEYASEIAPIVEARCLSCHDGSNPHIPSMTNFGEVSQLVVQDTGMDIFTLVRVSHIHLFGLTFIFFITSVIYSHAFVRQTLFKCVVIAIPFVAIIFDILSWYLTKMWRPFAYVVLISGGLMGVSFAIQWLTSMWQMWFYRLPSELADNDGVLPTFGYAASK
jgi:hypothetical protein